MKYSSGLVKLVFLFLISYLFASTHAKANDDKYAAQPLRGANNQIAKDSFNQVQDTVFYNLALRPTQTTYSIRNLITFKVDEYSTVAIPDTFKVTITFKVYYSKIVAGSIVQDSSGLQTLFVEYNKFRNYQNKAVYSFTGGVYSKAKIFSVTSTSSSGTFSTYSKVLMLENEIQVTREYAFDPNVNTVQSVAGVLGSLTDADSCSSAGEYLVNWGKVNAANEYDLEWAYIDSGFISNYYIAGTTTLNAKTVFNNNSTRVSITAENYQIPVLYENGGVLFYRVRAVSVRQSGQRIEGAWSSNYAGGLGSFGFNGHERDLNWQASTSFAEEGKRKSVVQYFDGVLKSRQTVTKDNNTCYTIVAETFYDFQGRPAIQVLPAPTLNRLIGYTPHFNRDVNGADYDKNIFDAEMTGGVNNCNAVLPGMGTMSGASQYYSSNNPLAYTGFHKFIPNAYLYPFSETRYTPDNTGRIAMQGGVGKGFQINSKDPTYSHESKYFYGSADQEELDALFGTEVGNASHYSKNMVKDPNGQYSVSYVDMHGRTIATALAGKPESKLDSLLSSNNKTITKRLLDTTNNLVSGTSIISTKALIVTRAGSHRIVYSLLPDSIKVKACNNEDICYDCLYDLEVTVSNDCSNPGDQPITIKRSNISINGPIDTSCTPNTTYMTVDTSINLTEGTYVITKKLTISQQGLEKYNEIFLRRNVCKSLQQFIDEQKILLLSKVQCFPTCQSCTDSLGTWSDFRNRYMINNNIANADTSGFREQAMIAYQEQGKICNELCNNTGLHNSIREQMLVDMTAPYGQYAEADSATDVYNIFYTNNGMAGLRFKMIPAGGYFKNESGMPDSIYNDYHQKVPPNHSSITTQNFLDNFKDIWAETLLPLHPEYCRLLKFETYSASHIWDERFAKIETFRQAKDSGFLNPSAFTGLPSSDIFAAPALAYRDPFFTSLEPGLNEAFKDSLINLIKSNNPNISAWSIATIMAHCDTADAACFNFYTSTDNAFAVDTVCRGELDFAWRYFRELYLNKKAGFIDNIVFNACPVNNLLPWHTSYFTNLDLLDGSYPSLTNPVGATNSLDSFFTENCNAYVIQWLDEMRPCNLPQNDSLEIITRLIAVCKAGSDKDHVYGSSTTRSGTLSAEGDSSFIQVLKSVLGSRYDSTCNAYLITAPKPYDKQTAYGDIEIWDKPDSCQCSRISALHEQFQFAKDSTFSDYVFRITGTRMYPGVLDTLVMLCNGQINCKFLETPMILPPALQCNVTNTCVDCATVGSVYKQFKIDFPGIIPTRTEVDSIQISRNNLFAKYMHTQLGFSKTVTEYLDFLDTCGINTACDTINSIISDFRNYYSSVSSGQAYKDVKITPVVDELILGFNGLLQRKRQYSFNAGLDNRYRNQTYDPDANFKFYSISHSIYSNSDSVFNLILPVNINYVNFSLSSATESYLPQFKTDQTVTNADFWHIPSATELGKKYYGYTLLEEWGRFRMMFSEAAHWQDHGPNYASMATYYGLNVPKLQFLMPNPPAPSSSLANAYQSVSFFKIQEVQPSLATYLQKYSDINSVIYDVTGTQDDRLPTGDLRDSLKLSNRLYHSSDIKKVIGFFIDKPMYDLYLASGQPIDHNGKGMFMRAKLQMVDGTFKDAYFNTNVNLWFKETIDSNLNDPDCVKAFTYYYNQQTGSNYTFTQIDSLYFARCGTHPLPCNTLTLCGSFDGAFPPANIPDLSPCADSTLFSVGAGTKLYNAYSDSLLNSFNDKYLEKCLKARYNESFAITAPISEFHYTLYYYDQAGNLVKTVPPTGVDVSKFSDAGNYSSIVKAARAAGTVNTPNHTLFTSYRYNTLNQVVAQKTPDAGLSNFWYDRLGRLAISQNARHKANSATELNRLYSYTKYDYLGRISEVGQIKNTIASEPITDALTRNNSTLNNWFAARNLVRGQMTITSYDIANAGYSGSESSTIWQRNLRNRVSYTAYYDTLSTSVLTYNNLTAYSYDIHGNVDTLLQDYGSSGTGGVKNIMNVQLSNSNRFKRIVYKYDLISGKVNQVAYQPPRGSTYYPDMFYQRYSYDAENRLNLVETSMDSVIWEREARYDYYRHGPLARTTLGHQLVQGVDYAYTLQGWLKGVNGLGLQNPDNDMGLDGRVYYQNQYVAKDAMGFALDYYFPSSYLYPADYKAINPSVNPFPAALLWIGNFWGEDRNLYNGNITGMAVNIKFPNPTTEQGAQYYNYKYDQLNRITGMDVFRGFNEANNAWGPSGIVKTNDYKERIAYDGNGNILKYLRNGITSVNVNMDSLSYNYYPSTNRLKYVRESVLATNYTDDIDDQTNTSNYTYDQIGNLTADAKEGITLIKWNVYGKITEIQRTATTANPVTNIKYTYDASGNRISKRAQKSGAIDYTWYVRDASGNVMATYIATGTNSTVSSTNYTLNLGEQHIYGSSRLGLINRNLSVKTTFVKPSIITFIRGSKFFELTNHLGNVLVTISDKKFGIDNATYDIYFNKLSDNPDGKIDFYNADVVTAQDYAPFGSLLTGRRYSQANTKYRYGFNGKENDNEVKGEGNQQDYGLRIYDPRLGRFLSVDPLTDEYPELTPYQFGSNRPIDGIDLDGAEWTPAELMEILAQAKAALGTLISENTIVLRGISNSIVNANLLGVPDKLGSWGTDNVSDYSTGANQKLYLWGRVVGDVAAALQGAAEISGGSAAVGGGLAVSTTGVGAVAGLPTAVVGALVTGHGAGTGAAAAIDLGETLGQLTQLGAFSTGASDAGKKSPEQSTNNQTNSAHGNSRKSNNSQHGYVIKDKKGQIIDQGISGQPLNKNGTSPRAQQKIREKYNNDPNLNQSVTKKNIGQKNGKTARENAINFEQGRQNAFSKSKKNPTPGTGASGQKRPKPKM